MRKDGYLEYYVNLVTVIDNQNKGIRLAKEDDLTSDNKLSLIKQGFDNPEENEVKSIAGDSRTIISY